MWILNSGDSVRVSHKWPSLEHKVDNEGLAGHVETKTSRELSFRSSLL